MDRIPPIVVMCVFVSSLPGCIAWEIRDEVRATNQHLCEVKPALVHTLHSVEETNREIAETQGQLTEVQASLALTQTQLDSLHASLRQTDQHVVAVGGTLAQTDQHLVAVGGTLAQTDQHLVAVGGALGETNPTLGQMQGELERMRVLSDVHAKLTEVNKAVGPLGSAMGSLGGAMSFLGISSDDSQDLLSDEDKAAAAEEKSEAGASPSGAESDSADPNASKRSEPILGTWVMVYPPPAPAGTASSKGGAGSSGMGRITVIMANGNLLFAETDKPIRTGKWSRKGRTLTFTLDPATPGGQAETASGELLTLNSRTLTIRRGDVVTVHARP